MDLAVRSWEKGGGADSDDCDKVALTEVGFPGSRWPGLFRGAVADPSRGLNARPASLKVQAYVRMVGNAKIAGVHGARWDELGGPLLSLAPWSVRPPLCCDHRQALRPQPQRRVP